MKVQIVYTSLTGCTRKVAEAICRAVEPHVEACTLHDLKNGAPALDGDVILMGFWCVGGNPSPEMQAFMRSVKGKAVGVFCTLGYYADSAHAQDTIRRGVELVREGNDVIGSYICNGAVAQKLMAGQGITAPRTPLEQKELRWEMVRAHPTDAECALAGERFRERVHLYERCKELNIPFQSIV